MCFGMVVAAHGVDDTQLHSAMKHNQQSIVVVFDERCTEREFSPKTPNGVAAGEEVKGILSYDDIHMLLSLFDLGMLLDLQ